MDNQTVLVTGGAGFIGSEVTRQLAKQCKKVIVLDNLSNGKRSNIEDLLSDNVELWEDDIRDKAVIERAVSEVQIIYHLACLGVRHSIHSPLENHQVNADATLQILELAKQSGTISRFVYVSSSEIYGTAKTVPMTEDHPADPHTVYGASKYAGEAYTRAYYRCYKFPTVVIRPFNAFGPNCHHEGDSGEVIPKFILRTMAGKPMIVFGDGSQTRDFTYVSDTARGIISAGQEDAAIGETINLASGKEIPILQLAKVIKGLFKDNRGYIEHHAPRPGDVLRLYGDATKAKEILGFETHVTLEEGLLKVLDWYETSGQSPESLLEDELIQNWQG